MRSAGTCALVILALARSLHAQVEPSGDWRTLHTPHFRIHFHPSYRDVALREAREAERSYALLATELHPPRETVDITLSDDFDGANGLTTVFPTDRVTLFLAPPATDPALAQYDDWLRLVSQHELTHVFHLDRARGVWSVMQSVFGRAPGLFPEEYQPSWVTEGLAVYYESKFTTAGRVHGSFHSQVLAADALDSTSRPRSDALLFTRWPDGYMPYAYGSRFFQSITQTLGDSVVPRFVEHSAGQWIPYRVGHPLAAASPGLDLDSAWRRDTRPDPGLGSAGTVVEHSLFSEPVPRVSPDRRRVVWLSDDGRGARRLIIADARTWQVVRTHLVNAGVSYDWVGDTVMVAQLDLTGPNRIRSDLYRWDPSGDWTRLTHGARLTEPRGGGGALVSVQVTPDGNHPTLPEVRDTAGTEWGDVVPSADRSWVAATRHRNGHWQLVRWPWAAPDSVSLLSEGSSLVSGLTWWGDTLLFVSDASGLPQVYRWSDSAAVRAITAEPLGARSPAVLPGGQVAYTSLRSGGWTLMRAPIRSGAALPAVPPAAPFDSAPPVPVRETGYTAWPSLAPHFWLPVFFDAGPSGRFGGAVTAGSDALGRWSYAAIGMGSVSPVRLRGELAVVADLLPQPVFDADVSSAWSNIGVTSGGTVVSKLAQDADLGATFRYRRWRTALNVRVAAEFERDEFVARPDTALAAVCIGCASRDQIGGSITLAIAHNTSGVLSVSPQNGFNWAVTYRRRNQQGSPLFADEYRTALALYAALPGPGFAPPVLALRFGVGETNGPLLRTLGVGGVSSGTYDLGFGQTVGGVRDFPVRGYSGDALVNRRAATGTAELRIPLALVGRSLGNLPLGADKVSLRPFVDAGDAWGPGASPRLTRLWSVGTELALDLTVNYDVPLALRLGLAEPMADPPGGGPRRPQGYLAFSSNF
ncbi:MAG TPA: hypothetical protein VFD85_11035 [Gemmatimonadales bacterium]|nr:hypothetical protein [Gemmatimonadales bacterium]